MSHAATLSLIQSHVPVFLLAVNTAVNIAFTLLAVIY